MATRISDPVRNGMADKVGALLDAGSGPGTVQIRTGAQPATVATAASGTLLATLTLSKPSFGAASAGVATATAITSDASADASGTAGWFRALDSAGNAVIDGSITVTGGGGDMTMASTSIVAGGTVQVTSWTVTAPAG